MLKAKFDIDISIGATVGCKGVVGCRQVAIPMPVAFVSCRFKEEP